MESYLDFRNKYLYKSVDVDGFPTGQPYQCWDYADGLYFPYIGGHKIHCGQSGYVKDIANQRNTNGILDFCVDVGLNAELQPGDICIWTNCADTPYSHIALYDHDNGQDAVYFSGQNQPVPYVNISRIGVSGIIGVFRPKIFMGKSPKPTPHKQADQILSVGSKVVSDGFLVERIDYAKDWIYNSSVGGWIPAADVDEVDSRDGSKDQWLHIGSGVAFNKGQMTVTGMRQDNGRWLIKCDKLNYEVLPDCLTEIAD